MVLWSQDSKHTFPSPKPDHGLRIIITALREVDQQSISTNQTPEAAPALEPDSEESIEYAGDCK